MTSKKNKLRKIIVRRLTVFWKLVIFWAVIGFSENFTVKAPKCDYNVDHQIPSENDDLEACDRILEICNLFGRNGVK